MLMAGVETAQGNKDATLRYTKLLCDRGEQDFCNMLAQKKQTKDKQVSSGLITKKGSRTVSNQTSAAENYTRELIEEEEWINSHSLSNDFRQDCDKQYLRNLQTGGLSGLLLKFYKRYDRTKTSTYTKCNSYFSCRDDGEYKCQKGC